MLVGQNNNEKQKMGIPRNASRNKKVTCNEDKKKKGKNYYQEKKSFKTVIRLKVLLA